LPDISIWDDMMFMLDSMSQFVLVLLLAADNPGSFLTR